MELRHLRYFRAVAEEAHVTRAAARLGIAQPPLTQQIKALEAELGILLFDRIGRRVELTEAGRVLLGEARAILDHVERAVSLTQQAGQGSSGRLRVGFTGSASFHPVVTEVLKAVRSEWPGVELVLEESKTDHLAAALDQGKLDTAFVRPPLQNRGTLSFQLLATEALMVAVPVTHALAGRESLRLTDLAEESFILYPRATGPGLSEGVVMACVRAGFSPRVAQQTPQLSSTINMVAASLGIAVVPECLRHLRLDSVRFIRLVGDQPRAELGLAYRSGERSPVVLNFVATSLRFRQAESS
jgi:DNA-binding transcriptional LysR family regulator